jgi:two-component system, NarL family, response regulator LiaR
MFTPIRVLIADDHPIVREGLQKLLSCEPSIEIVGEAMTGREAVSMAATLQPHVILMDLMMPDLDGIQATEQIRAVSPSSQVLILTSFSSDHQVCDSIQAGAAGYLLKDVHCPELLRAIHAVAQGKPCLHAEAQRHLMHQVASPATYSCLDNLTPRERAVLHLIADGHSNQDIAAKLDLSAGTVKWYVSSILAKLGVADRTNAALYAIKHGLINRDR